MHHKAGTRTWYPHGPHLLLTNTQYSQTALQSGNMGSPKAERQDCPSSARMDGSTELPCMGALRLNTLLNRQCSGMGAVLGPCFHWFKLFC